MINAPTVAEKRPVFWLVIAMKSKNSRLGRTKTSIPLESSFQEFAARLSYFSASFIYSIHIFFADSFWSVAGVTWVAMFTGRGHTVLLCRPPLVAYQELFVEVSISCISWPLIVFAVTDKFLFSITDTLSSVTINLWGLSV